jgi:hypothetical protein
VDESALHPPRLLPNQAEASFGELNPERLKRMFGVAGQNVSIAVKRVPPLNPS